MASCQGKINQEADFYCYEHYSLKKLSDLHHKSHCSYTIDIQDSCIQLRLNPSTPKQFHENETEKIYTMDYFNYNLYQASSTVKGNDQNLYLTKQKEVRLADRFYVVDCYQTRETSNDGATTIYFNKALGCLAIYLDSWFTLCLNQKNHDANIDAQQKAVIKVLMADEEFFPKTFAE